MSLKRIVFIHPYLLHYHYPRLDTLSELCQEVGISLTNITITTYTQQYRPLIEQHRNHFETITLFPQENLETVPEKRMWPLLREKLAQCQPDVIFVYGYYLQAFRRVKLWAARRNIATVLISDSNNFDRSRNRWFEWVKSLWVRRYEAAFVGGESSSLYVQKLKIPGERIFTGYDVIDNELFRKLAAANREGIASVRQKWNLPENFFLFVGRLLSEKNLHRLLEAYYDYAQGVGDETHLWSIVICGSGPAEDELRNQVNRLPAYIGQQIHFYGLIKQPELIDFFSCASCFILPSKTESWGLVVNEAMACGLPVIISNRCGCCADLVKEGQNGWSFDPEDTRALVGLMHKIQNQNLSTRQAMGRCSEGMISHWGLDTFARNALSCAQIAYQQRRPRPTTHGAQA